MSEFYCGGWVEGGPWWCRWALGRLGLSYHPPTHHEAFGERSGGGLIERFFHSTPLDEDGGPGFSQERERK